MQIKVLQTITAVSLLSLFITNCGSIPIVGDVGRVGGIGDENDWYSSLNSNNPQLVESVESVGPVESEEPVEGFYDHGRAFISQRSKLINPDNEDIAYRVYLDNQQKGGKVATYYADMDLSVIKPHLSFKVGTIGDVYYDVDLQPVQHNSLIVVKGDFGNATNPLPLNNRKIYLTIDNEFLAVGIYKVGEENDGLSGLLAPVFCEEEYAEVCSVELKTKVTTESNKAINPFKDPKDIVFKDGDVDYPQVDIPVIKGILTIKVKGYDTSIVWKSN